MQLQLKILDERVKRYWSTMAYLFNTGQGVLAMRSPLSDRVFADTLMRCGMARSESYDFYVDYARNATREYTHPHAVLYCHAPYDAIMARLRQSENAYEKSAASRIDVDFIKQLDTSYRELIDKHYRPYCEVVEVDMSALLNPKVGVSGAHQESGTKERSVKSLVDSLEYDFLVEDLQALDLTEVRSLDNPKRLETWLTIYRNQDTLRLARLKYTSLTKLYQCLSMPPPSSCPEFKLTAPQRMVLDAIMKRDPRFARKFAQKWDPKFVGWSDVLFRFELKEWTRSPTMHAYTLPINFEEFARFYIPENTRLKEIVDARNRRWFKPDTISINPLTALFGGSQKALSS